MAYAERSVWRCCDLPFCVTIKKLAMELACHSITVRQGELTMAIDPVCGMEVDEKTAAATSEYKRKIYYFCAPGCKAAFDEEPERYLKGENSGGHQHSHHH
jgi:YHS domain-containing protein